MPDWLQELLWMVGAGGGAAAGSWAALRGQLERVRDNVHHIADSVQKISNRVEVNHERIVNLRIRTALLDKRIDTNGDG